MNTSARKVNSDFEVLPAGTAAGIRSSFDSQGSARKKLQKQRTSRSYSR